MEPIRRNGETIYPPYDDDLPNDGIKVEPLGEITDMSRKAPPNGHDTEELSIALHKLTAMLDEQTEVLTKVAGAVAVRPNGWKGPSGIWTIVGIAVIVVSIIGEFIRLEDKVAFQSGTQATIEKMQDTLTRMDERQKTENLAARVVSLEKANMFEYGANEQKRTDTRKR